MLHTQTFVLPLNASQRNTAYCHVDPPAEQCRFSIGLKMMISVCRCCVRLLSSCSHFNSFSTHTHTHTHTHTYTHMHTHTHINKHTPHTYTHLSTAIMGPFSLTSVQNILSSITYTNNAIEPTAGLRSISFQVYDGVHTSNVMTVSLLVVLVPDAPPLVVCGPGQAFTEQSITPIVVAPVIVISDQDTDHIISNATIFISNPAPGDRLSLTIPPGYPGLSVAQQSITSLLVYGDKLDTIYQVSVSPPTQPPPHTHTHTTTTPHTHNTHATMT